MPLLHGTLTVTCPKSGEKVTVKNTCVSCEFYKHISWEGLTPLIACNYEKKPDPEPTEKKREGIGGLRRW